MSSQNTFLLLVFVVINLAAANEGAASFNSERQRKLSQIIDETLDKDNVNTTPIFHDLSSPLYTGLSSSRSLHCDSNNLAKRDTRDDNSAARVGCCQSNSVQLFYNVKIEHKKFIVYSNTKGVAEDDHILPSIDSMILQQRHGFQMHTKKQYSAGKS